MCIVALYKPCIPANVGNIVRSCALSGSQLVVVGPVGFAMSSKEYKRSALKYRMFIDLKFVGSIEDLFQIARERGSKIYAFSSHATTLISEVSFSNDDILLFGSENQGLPIDVLQMFENESRGVIIPMYTQYTSEIGEPVSPRGSFCYNLANSVAIATYEVWRQTRSY